MSAVINAALPPIKTPNGSWTVKFEMRICEGYARPFADVFTLRITAPWKRNRRSTNAPWPPHIPLTEPEESNQEQP